ncbi:MAG: restriction endonuclease [Xanthomonadales bacterium]|nr:restriction endonuclease [Xanthomonadales bacterium]
MTNMWMVRAGQKARFLDEFRDKSSVAIGWGLLKDLSGIKSQADMAEAVRQAWPEWTPAKVRMSASQVYRFAHEIQTGDRVISYDPQARAYLLGDVLSDYLFQPNSVAGWGHIRKVDWKTEVDRDALSTSTKNSLGAISTLFRVPDEAADEIEAIARGEKKTVAPAAELPVDDLDLLEDIEERAREFIKDKISSLDWEEMQELVAGILRAMGYKTEVSPVGPDRGKDIVASPDGFGFESPRIVVEVKHRKGQMGAQAIRSFLGGRHKDDKGLYVSTGGFSKDAHYEAERAKNRKFGGDDIPYSFFDSETAHVRNGIPEGEADAG